MRLALLPHEDLQVVHVHVRPGPGRVGARVQASKDGRAAARQLLQVQRRVLAAGDYGHGRELDRV